MDTQANIADNQKIKVTILTPTYNRAYTIPKLYKSLLKQSDYCFKWLIVDDGSTDNTKEVVGKFQNAYFQIKYLYKENGGKHTAINFGVKYIDTEYTFIVDSDDYLSCDANELVNNWIKDIDGSTELAGVAGTRVSARDGSIIGECRITSEYLDCYNSNRRKMGLLGDKAEIYKTRLLRENPFPIFENEKFLPESVVWNKFSLMNLKIRWHKDGIVICEYLDDGLTSKTKKINFFKENINGFKEDCKVNLKALPFPYNYSAGSVYYAKCIAADVESDDFMNLDVSFIPKLIIKILGKIRYRLGRY